jgi:rhodanese-related sulfurtransferase
MKTVRDAFLTVVLTAVFALLFNTARNSVGLKGLAMNTPWPENRQKVELEIPPSYAEGDSLISLEQAYGMFLSGNAIFIDTREQEEYDEGHIAGALNLPFEFWDDYWEYVEPEIDPEMEIIAYCGGFDCELSLFAARELKSLGYEKSYTFFGGWQKWIDADLPIEETVYEDDGEYEEFYEDESQDSEEG